MLRRFAFWFTGAALLLAPASAFAIQKPLNGAERLHTFGSSQPGAEFNSGGLATGGQVSYSSGTQILTLTAAGDTLNWFDPTVGSGCEIDGTTNCAFNYAPDLTITFSAEFDSLVETPIPTTTLSVLQLNFKTTSGTDLVVTDPTDIGFGPVLTGNLQAGIFGGTPTTGLSAQLLWDASLNGGLGGISPPAAVLTTVATLKADASSHYSSLVLPDFFGLAFTSVTDWNGCVGTTACEAALDSILQAALAGGNLLPSFTAEVNGEVVNLQAGSFVPEPSTLLLLGAALAALAGRVRR